MTEVVTEVVTEMVVTMEVVLAGVVMVMVRCGGMAVTNEPSTSPSPPSLPS